ncbi:hypothetical protein H5410_057965 [Solanum commersonii]|uniref:Uncharacterized protein n=1 Tax=Solanum commersonii TaxID=4109 RepID=A0A9J5WRH2_SOLCO|nr:hypothetical protein H5410_057965 [Solanum commersonii]
MTTSLIMTLCMTKTADKSALSESSLASVLLSQSDPTSGISDAAAAEEVPPKSSPTLTESLPNSSPTLAEALPKSSPTLAEVLPNTSPNFSPTIGSSGCATSSNPKPSLSSKV